MAEYINYVNYVLCALLVVVLLFEIVLIVRRNRTVDFKGKDDFFTITIILFLAIVIFPMQADNTVVESLRNTLVYVAIFGSAGVKRGFSTQGVEKLFFTIKWDQVKELYLEENGTSKVMLRIVTDKRAFKLFFSIVKVKAVIKYLQEKGFQVNISETLRI